MSASTTAQFEALIAAEDGDYAWVEGSEREPCMLCYTSGTTGNPKGVLYEHRSSVIHAMAEVAPSCFDLSPSTVALPIVPMFHAAAWGLPFAGAMAGIKFVYAAVNDPVAALPADERGEGDPQRRRADRLALDVPAYGRDRRGAGASAGSSPSAARPRRAR